MRERLAAWERRLSNVLAGLAALCFLAIFATVVLLVVLRYVFHSSITGANELITVLFVYSTSLGAAVAIGRGEHIRIEAAIERFPRGVRRALDTVGVVLVGALHLVLLAYSVPWIATTGEFLMPSTQLPRIVAQLSVPIGSSLAVVYCALRLVVPKTREETTP